MLEQRCSCTVKGVFVDLLNDCVIIIFQVDMYKDVLVSCGHVLDKDPNNIKALYRSGKVIIF